MKFEDALTRAHACCMAGRLAEAEQLLQQALAGAAEKAELHKSLADVQAELGKNAEARTSYERAIALDAGYFNPHANLANLLLDEGEIDAAIAHYQRAVELRPDIAELHDSLGQAFREKGVSHAARAMFLQALKLKPELAAAHFNLASNMESGGQFQMAREHYQKAITLSSDMAAARAGLARVSLKLNDVVQAREQIKVLEAQPDRVPPEALQHLHADLAIKEKRFDEAMALRQALLARAPRGSEEQRVQYVLLAELHDEMGKHDAAFDALERAHATRPRVFDQDAVFAEFDAHRQIYTPQEMASLPRADNSLRQPIFLFGMPRAGKSLTESLLALHPSVYGMDELLGVNHFRLQKAGSHHSGSRAESAKALSTSALNQMAVDFVDIAEEYLQDVGLSFKDGIRHVVSTTPANFWNLPLIHRLFPQAPLIHVTRHPLDTCLMCFFKEFGNEAHAYADNLESLGAYFLKYQEMIAHWRDVLKIPMLEIRYEDMVGDPVKVAQQLYGYVGLDMTDVVKATLERVGFSGEQVGCWQYYKTQLEPLVASLAKAGETKSSASG